MTSRLRAKLRSESLGACPAESGTLKYTSLPSSLVDLAYSLTARYRRSGTRTLSANGRRMRSAAPSHFRSASATRISSPANGSSTSSAPTAFASARRMFDCCVGIEVVRCRSDSNSVSIPRRRSFLSTRATTRASRVSSRRPRSSSIPGRLASVVVLKATNAAASLGNVLPSRSTGSRYLAAWARRLSRSSPARSIWSSSSTIRLPASELSMADLSLLWSSRRSERLAASPSMAAFVESSSRASRPASRSSRGTDWPRT